MAWTYGAQFPVRDEEEEDENGLRYGEQVPVVFGDYSKATYGEQFDVHNLDPITPPLERSMMVQRPDPEQIELLQQKYGKPAVGEIEEITARPQFRSRLGTPSEQQLLEQKYPGVRDKMKALEDAAWEGREETGWGELFTKSLNKILPSFRKQIVGGLRGGNPVTVSDLERNAMAEQMITGTGRMTDSIENNRIAKEWGFEEGSDTVPPGVHPVDAFAEWLGSDEGRGEVEAEAAKTPVAMVAQDIWDAEAGKIRENEVQVKPQSAKYYAAGILDAGINMGPAMAATIVTKNPMVGAAIMGGQVYGDTYGSMLDEGYSPDQARAAAMFSAAAETLTERISLGILTRNNFTGLKRILAGASAEGIQEPVTEALQIGYDVGILNDDMTMGEAMWRLIDAGIIGFGVGGGMGAGVEVLQQAENQMTTPAAKEAFDYEQEMDALHLSLTKESQEVRALEVLEENTELLDKVINDQLADVSTEDIAALEEQELIRIKDDGTVVALPKARRQVARQTVAANRRRKKEALRARGVSDGELEPTIEILDMAPAFHAAETDTNLDPTESQKGRGNYRKGRFTWNNIPLAIETPAGETRSGVDEQGRPWSQVMSSGYGYFPSKPGADTVEGEPTEGVDAYFGPDLNTPTVYVLNQAKDPGAEAVGENFDEHKVMVGYPSLQAAIEAYQADYAPARNQQVEGVAMQPQQFKAWLDLPEHMRPLTLGEREGYDKAPVFATVEATRPTPERYPARGKNVTGAPPKDRAFEDIDPLIDKTVAILEDSAMIPDEAWTWYEDSGRKIREITRNDPELMHRVVQILAATSQGAGVGANTTFMIKGAYAMAKGEVRPETGMYPATAGKNIETMSALETQEIDNNLPGIGSKVMSFYRNLYDSTFNTNLYPDDVTIDRWMVRNLGYTAGDSVEGTQYDYARKIFQDAAARYNARNGTNWLPRHAQAALWVHERSKASMAKTGKETPVDAFAEHIEAVTARVTHEAVPSKTTEQGRQVDALPREEKQELGRRQREALAENNTHVVMEALGVPLYNVATAIGGYDGMINPNEISNIVMVGGAELDRPRADVFSQIMQYIYTQDAVPWFRAERKAQTSEATGNFGRKYTQGINWDLQGPLNEDQETALFDALRKALGPDAGFSMVGEDQLVIIDFKDEKGVTFSGLKPAEFIEKIDQIGENIGADLGVVNSYTFGAEGNYLTHDWETDPNGQRLEEAIQEYASTRGPPDLLERVRAWRESAQGITRDFLKADTKPRAGAAAPVPVARLADRSATEDAIFGRFGSVDRTRDTTEELKFYDLTPVVENPELTDRLADSFGYTIEVFSFEADNFKLPRLGKKNYEEGTVWIYDPAAAHGSFKDETYTRAWRVSHEIAHGITERMMQNRYGDSKRYGRLGRPMMGERGVPPKRVEVELEPLTLLQAQRAVEWEDVAFRVQRILLDKMGISIPDSVFNQEYNTNIADATFRTVTGDFADAGEFGFRPSVFKPTIKSILTGLERTEQALAEDQGREATEGIDLATYNQISDEQLQESIDLQSREPADKPLFSVVPGVPADTKWYRGSEHEQIRLHRETGIVHASTSEKTASAFGPVSEVTLHVQNPFDYENPDHTRALKAQFRTNAQLMKFARALDVVHGGERTWLGGEGTMDDVREYFNVGLEMGNYQVIESPAVLEAIRGMGHDSAYMVENDFGPKGIAVFDAGLMTRDAPLFATIEDEVFPGFYSGLARAARNLKQEKGTGKQMLAMLTKMPGVKAEELDWTGVPEYLKAKKTVTKDQLIAFIDANGVRIEETTLGYKGTGKGQMPEDVDWRRVQDAYEAGEIGDVMNLTSTLTEEQMEVIDERGSEYVTWESMTGGQRNEFAKHVYNVNIAGQSTRPAEYGGDSVTLPGGKNYREILLRLPEKSIDAPTVSTAKGWVSDATLRNLNAQMAEKFNAPMAIEQRDLLQGGSPVEIMEMLDDWEARLGLDVSQAKAEVAPPPVSMTVLQLEEGPAIDDLSDVIITQMIDTPLADAEWGWVREEARFEFENLNADQFDIVHQLSRDHGVQLISGVPEERVPRADRVNGVIELPPGYTQSRWEQVNKNLDEIGLTDQNATWVEEDRRFYIEGVSPTMLERANYAVSHLGLSALQEPSATPPVKRAPAGRRPIETYHAAHWGSYANILASIRITERIGEEGERIMFIEEIQSDWHQQGRTVGYRDRPRGLMPERDDLKAIKKPLTDTADYWEIRTKVGQFVVNVTATDGVLPDEDAAIDQGYQRLTQEEEIRRRIAREEQEAVPDAPFKGNAWAELAIKRVMRLAAEEGFDSVAWTTGEQQAERYSLSRVLNSIKVLPAALEGRPDVRIVWLDPHMGSSIQLHVTADGMIDGSDQAEFDKKKLSEVVGTPMAKRIMETEESLEIPAENLDVGGQGMKSFYDRTIRNLVSKVTKKLDKAVQTSSTRIDTSEGRGGPYTVGRYPGSPPAGTPVAEIVQVQQRQLGDLAEHAKSFSDEEYGSEEQIESSNNFVYTLQQILPDEAWENFEEYAHRATTDEMVDYGMSLAAREAPQVIVTHGEMGTLAAMAETARPLNQADFGTARQLNASTRFFDELYEFITDDQQSVIDDMASDPDQTADNIIDAGLSMVVGQSPDVEPAPPTTVVSQEDHNRVRRAGQEARPAEDADVGSPEQERAYNAFTILLSEVLPSYAMETWEEEIDRQRMTIVEKIRYGEGLAEEESWSITTLEMASLERTAQEARARNDEDRGSDRQQIAMEAFSAELIEALPRLAQERWKGEESEGVDDDLDSGLRMARLFAGRPDAAPVQRRVVADQWGIKNKAGEWTGPYASEEEAIEGAAKRDLEDLEGVHLVDISDQMRDRLITDGLSLFAVARQPAPGVPIANLQSVISEILDLYPGSPNVKIAPTEAHMPRKQLIEIKHAGMEGKVGGMFDPETGDVYLIAANLKNMKQAVEIYLHETVGHYGVRSILGAEYDTIMDQVWRSHKEKVRAAARRNGLDVRVPSQRRIAAEEFIAYRAQRVLSGQKIPARDASLLQRLVEAIRIAIARLRGVQMSDADIQRLIRKARMFVATPANKSPGLLPARKAPIMFANLWKAINNDRVPNSAKNNIYRDELYAQIRAGNISEEDAEPLISYLSDVRVIDKAGLLNEIRELGNRNAFHAVEDDAARGRWFGNSKVVDEKGEPLVVYHGTFTPKGEEPFTAFDKEARGKSTRTWSAQNGFWFSASEKNAEQFAVKASTFKGEGERRVLPIYLSIQNPLEYTREQMVDKNITISDAVREAKAAGNDGAIMRGMYDNTNRPVLRLDGVGLGVDHRSQFLSDTFPAFLEGRETAKNALEEIKEAAAFYATEASQETDPEEKAYQKEEAAMWRSIGDAFADDPSRLTIYQGEPADVFVAFEPEQIKSATENIGTYDPASANILMHVDEYNGRADAIESGDLFENFTIEEGSKTSRAWNYLVYKAQDKFIDLLNVQKAIEMQTGRPLSEELDTYLAEELFHGRVKSRVDRFEKDFIRPLTEAIDDSEYTWDEVEWFLYARHAPEANRRLYRINRSGALRRARNKAKQKAETKLEKRIARIDANKATQRNKIEAEHTKRLAVIESEYRSQMRRSKESQKKRREGIETAKANKIKRADARKQQQIAKLESKYKYVRADYELTYQAEIEEADVSFREREQERVKEDPGLLALSGMSNADAALAMEALREKGDISQLEAIAAQVDAMTARNREIMVGEGLEEQSTIDAWEKAYDFYVPLKGWKDGPMNTTFFPKKGKGYDTGGKLNQRRLGRRSLAANILANIVAQHQSAVVMAEKAKVGRTLLKMVQENPNEDIWTANQIETKKRLDPKSGLVVTAVDPTYKLRDNVLRVKVEGKDYHITFNEENPTAMRIATSMKNLSSEEINWLFQSLLKLNRILSAVNTSYNPEFIVSNLARDLQTAMININATDAQNMKMAILKDVFKAHRGIRRFLELPSFKNPESADYWRGQFEEYRDLGGQVGWLDNYKDVQDLEASLYRDMQDKTAGTLSWSTLRRVGKFIEAENQAVENAVRLSAFVHAKTAGLSPRKAASLAKNLTVNFNRKGELGTQLNAVYLFYNASIQGMAVMWNAAKSPKVRKIMYGIVAFAATLEIMNRMLAGDDDDGENRYDKIPAWVKERNMIIMIPDRFRSQSPDDFVEHYITIPLPYGYNMLHVIGQKIGGIIDYTGIGNKREWSPLEDTTEILSAALGSFNPIGTGPTPLQTISPTILTPWLQVSENVAWHGGPVMPEASKYDPAPEPESQQYYRSVPKHAIALAEFLNKLGGGTKARPAPISPLDISPETIQLVEDFLTGGAGRFITNTIELGLMAKEHEVNMRKVPFARRFIGVTDERAVSDRYYENRTKIEYAIQEIKVAEEEIKLSGTQAEREDAIKNRQRILEQYRPDAAMKEALRLVQKGLRDLNATRKAVRQSKRDDDWKKEREEQIELQKTKLMNKFNTRYNQIIEKRRQAKEETAMNPQLPGKQRLAAVQQFNQAGYPATAQLIGSLPVSPSTDFVERLNA